MEIIDRTIAPINTTWISANLIIYIISRTAHMPAIIKIAPTPLH